HMETRELPIYNLVVAKEGAKLKRSEDQTPPPIAAGGPPQICGPAAAALPLPPPPPPPGGGQRGFDMSALPRGATFMMMGPGGMTMQATSVPVTNLVNMLQQFAGRMVVDKTDLKGLFDIKLTFSPEGITLPGGGPGPGLAAGPPPTPGGAATPAAADPL